MMKKPNKIKLPKLKERHPMPPPAKALPDQRKQASKEACRTKEERGDAGGDDAATRDQKE